MGPWAPCTAHPATWRARSDACPYRPRILELACGICAGAPRPTAAALGAAGGGAGALAGAVVGFGGAASRHTHICRRRNLALSRRRSSSSGARRNGCRAHVALEHIGRDCNLRETAGTLRAGCLASRPARTPPCIRTAAASGSAVVAAACCWCCGARLCESRKEACGLGFRDWLELQSACRSPASIVTAKSPLGLPRCSVRSAGLMAGHQAGLWCSVRA